MNIAMDFRHVRYLVVLALLYPFALLAAQGESPDALVRNVTDEVLNILRQDKAIQNGDVRRAGELIETRIAPHFDFARMTQLAVGPAWRKADAQQRQQLTDAFRALLVRTYANALTAYKDQTVSFKPVSQGQDAREVTVRSQIRRPGGQPVSIDYSLARGDGGEWKVFDVVVADISLVTTYRSSFASEVSRDGIDGLIRAIQAKNRSNTASTS